MLHTLPITNIRKQKMIRSLLKKLLDFIVFYCELSLLNAVSWKDGGFNVVLRMMDLNEGEIRLLKMKKEKIE